MASARGLVSLLKQWFASAPPHFGISSVLILISSFAVVAAGIAAHELGHWVFVVPFGGSLVDWHWYTPIKHIIDGAPSHIATPARQPFNSVNFYAGGLIGGILVGAFLILWILPKVKQTRNPFWQYGGAILSFYAVVELALGVIEGMSQGNGFYSQHPTASQGIAALFGFIGLSVYLYRLLAHIRIQHSLVSS